MKPEEIVKVLEGRGWMARIVSKKHVPDLVEVEKGKGLLKCVDGRASDAEGGMRGPKTLGGVYAIASMRGVTDKAGLASLVEEVRKAGYVPSVHGDEHASPPGMGCGYFKLWSQGKLEGLEPPAFDSEEGKAEVLDAGGKYETLKGKHYEVEVVVNLVPGTTLEPAPHDQRFVVDAWVAPQFELDVPTYLTLAVSTVEQLSKTCRSARLVVDE